MPVMLKNKVEKTPYEISTTLWLINISPTGAILRQRSSLFQPSISVSVLI